MQYSNLQRQQGVALIISLIVLAAMTVLGVSSIRSTGIQQLIIKNQQFLMAAQNIARTEINGQLDLINLNGDLPDTIMNTLISLKVNNPLPIADTTGSNTDKTALAYEQTAFDQKTTMTMTCRRCTAPIGGFSYGLGISALTGVIESEASMNDSAATSTQEQGFWYLMP
jgi:Tfp pilus assembly protein PilX